MRRASFLRIIGRRPLVQVSPWPRTLAPSVVPQIKVNQGRRFAGTAPPAVNKTSKPLAAISPSIHTKQLEDIRKRIHAVLFPFSPSALSKASPSLSEISGITPLNLSKTNAEELIRLLSQAIKIIDINSIQNELKAAMSAGDATIMEPVEEEAASQVEGSDQEATTLVNEAGSNNEGIAAMLQSESNSEAHPAEAAVHPSQLRQELALRYELMASTLGLYAPHISHVLIDYIRETIQNSSILEDEALEGVARWCFTQSFLINRLHGNRFHSLKEARPIPEGSRAGSGSVTQAKGIVAEEKIQQSVQARKVYEVLMLDYLGQYKKGSTNGSTAAARIIKSIERTLDDAREQLAIVWGEGLDNKLKIHQRTRQVLAAQYRARARPSLRGLLAIWTRVSFETEGRQEEPSAATLPAAAIPLELCKLSQGAYPLKSDVWDQAVTSEKATIDESISLEPSPDDENKLKEYANQLLTRKYLTTPALLRATINSAANRGHLETVWTLWPSVRDHLVAQSAHGQEDLQTLCLLLTVMLSISSFSPHAQTAQRAVAELLEILPSPTPLTIYHTLLDIYSSRQAASVAREIPASAQRDEQKRMYNNLKATWKRMKDESVDRELKSYQLAVQGFGAHGDVEGVKACWQELAADERCRNKWEQNLTAGDNVTYPPNQILNVFISTLLNTPRASGGSAIALSIFGLMIDPKQPYKPDIITINTMLRHYGATKDLKEMIKLMDMLPTFDLKPDVYTYTTLVEGLLKSGRRETARETLDIMEQSGIAPSTATYSLLISDLAKSGESDNMIRAESLIKKMRMAKLAPTVITYTALLDGYFRANRPQAGVSVLKQMERDGIVLNKVTYNMILRSIVNSNVDSRLVDKAIKYMGGSSSSFQGAYSSIINAMLKSNAVPDDDTWFIILSGLHRSGRFDEAEEVIKEMERQRFKPLSGSALSRVMGDLLERRPARSRRLR